MTRHVWGNYNSMYLVYKPNTQKRTKYTHVIFKSRRLRHKIKIKYVVEKVDPIRYKGLKMLSIYLK